MVLLVLLACSGSGGGLERNPTCFRAGTPVATVQGPVPIEAVEVGDRVWSGNGEGLLVQRRVVDTISGPVGHVLLVELGDRTIEVTEEHPFYSLSEGDWVDAGDLLPGEALLGLDGQPVRVRSITEADRPTQVFNLTVEAPERTYFAGGVLVHNKAVDTSGILTRSRPMTSWARPDFQTTWIDDGELPTDTDGDGRADTGCGDALDISIADPLGAEPWDFGLVSSGTWTGEDCLNGYGTLQLCHVIELSHRLHQVCLSDDVVAGSTTLFDASVAPDLTYYFHEGGGCFVTGADPSYYAALGCWAP